jgi:serine protease
MSFPRSVRGRGRRRWWALAITLLLVGLVVPAAAGAAAGAPAGTTPAASFTGNLLVMTRLVTGRQASAAAVRASIAAVGAQPAGHSVPQIGLVTVRPLPGVSAMALAARLRRVPGVLSVQPERRYVPRTLPDDPALNEEDPAEGVPYQWYLLQEDFPQAWALAEEATSRGTPPLVGVIDTGIDASDPDLSGQIAAAVDQQDPSDATGTARTDEVGHGTNVASLACAATNNDLGIAGAGDGCRLIVEKSDFSDSSIDQSIVDATDRGALAINMSFGPDNPYTAGPAPDSEIAALDYAAAHRVVLVAAAADAPDTEQGDPGNALQPAGTGPSITEGMGLDVTAAQYGGSRAAFAGYGSEISLAAYGTFAGSQASPCADPPFGIFGEYPGNATELEQPPAEACRTTFDGDDRYAYVAGTSMAAPQVAALGAMLRKLNPDARLGDILGAIKFTARRAAGSGWTSDLGWGILDAAAAVQLVRQIDRTPPVSVLLAPAISHLRRLMLRWRGHDVQQPGLIASGIALYDVYVTTGGRRPRLIARTARHTLIFHGRPGVRYVFTLVAVDRAGNRQQPAARAVTLIARGAK